MNIIEDDSIPDFPLYIYIYNADGMHNGKISITNQMDLERHMDTDIRNAFLSKCEVRITDVVDNLCWHAVNGKLIFPTPEMMR